MSKLPQKSGLTLILLSLFSSFLYGQKTTDVLAVISEVSGTAILMKSNENDGRRVIFGMQLGEGDLVKTEKKGKVAMLFSNGNLISMGPGQSMIISANGMSEQGIRLNEGLAGGFTELAMRKDQKGEMGVLIKLRNDEASQLILPGSPCNTVISTNRPAMSWESFKSADEFKIRLYDSNGLVWEKSTTRMKLEYPQDETELEFGQSYFWNVEGLDLIDSFRSHNQKFTILSKEMIQKVEEEKEHLNGLFSENPNSSSLHSLLGAYYMKIGLLEDAITEFETVRDANPESSLPHEILGGLYSSVGKKDLAIAELQEALKLEKEKNSL